MEVSFTDVLKSHLVVTHLDYSEARRFVLALVELEDGPV
jgi:hypothetical protein